MSNREHVQPAKHLLRALTVGGLLAPFSAFAQTTIETAMDKILEWLGLLLPLLSSLAVVYFFVGVIRFLGHAGDEKHREEGKNIMIWGMIALFVIVALWGIVGYLQVSFGLDQSGVTGSVPHTPTGPLPSF